MGFLELGRKYEFSHEVQRGSQGASHVAPGTLEKTTLLQPKFICFREPSHQAPLSMGFLRQEPWSGLPFPPPRNLSNPGIEPESPVWQADSLPVSLHSSVWKPKLQSHLTLPLALLTALAVTLARRLWRPLWANNFGQPNLTLDGAVRRHYLSQLRQSQSQVPAFCKHG